MKKEYMNCRELNKLIRATKRKGELVRDVYYNSYRRGYIINDTYFYYSYDGLMYSVEKYDRNYFSKLDISVTNDGNYHIYGSYYR